MAEREDWGPWVDHDGLGCPCVGQWVQWQLEDPLPGIGKWVGPEQPIHESGGIATFEGVAGRQMAWDWSNFCKRGDHGGIVGRIIRYRIRRPRAMEQLRRLAADPPRIREKTDA